MEQLTIAYLEPSDYNNGARSLLLVNGYGISSVTKNIQSPVNILKAKQKIKT